MYHESWGSHGSPDCFFNIVARSAFHLLHFWSNYGSRWWKGGICHLEFEISRHLIQLSGLDLLHSVIIIDEALEQLQKCAKQCDQENHTARNLGYLERKPMWAVPKILIIFVYICKVCCVVFMTCFPPGSISLHSIFPNNSRLIALPYLHLLVLTHMVTWLRICTHLLGMQLCFFNMIE